MKIIKGEIKISMTYLWRLVLQISDLNPSMPNILTKSFLHSESFPKSFAICLIINSEIRTAPSESFPNRKVSKEIDGNIFYLPIAFLF